MNLPQELYNKRLTWLIYAPGKVGKTSLLGNVLDHEDNILYLISADHSTKRLELMANKYKGRLVIVPVWNIFDARTAIADVKERILSKALSKYPNYKIWVALDGISHLQARLLTDSRKMAVSKEEKQRVMKADGEIMLREMTQQVDWNINLAQMTELTDALMSIPVNIVFTAQETQDKDERYVPALSGGSKSKVTGDVDLVARLVKRTDGRFLVFNANDQNLSGDRTGVLADTEPADLIALHDKILPKEVLTPTLEASSN